MRASVYFAANECKDNELRSLLLSARDQQGATSMRALFQIHSVQNFFDMSTLHDAAGSQHT